MENVKISSFEIENLKRVRLVSYDCSGKALTVIGGRNGQGKTSNLDGIMWALGGDKYKPSKPVHVGAEESYVKVTLSNGIIAERKGKNGALKLTSPTGRGGQALLNEFISTFALDLPKFMTATGIEKAKMLLESFPGLGPKLQKLNELVKALYSERLAIGQVADRKAKYAEELPYIEGVPEVPLSGTEMAQRMKDALSVNAANDAIRANIPKAEEDIRSKKYRVDSIATRIESLKKQIADAEVEWGKAARELNAAEATLSNVRSEASVLKDQDTTAIEAEMVEIDGINAKVRANAEKAKAEQDAAVLREQYNELATKIEEARAERLGLLTGVKMPLEALSIDEEGELIYRGQRWDCMSGAERMQVGTAICAAIKPTCGFVLLDELERLDVETLREFGAWLKEQNLQAIGTRVGTGSENSIIIEDGVVSEINEESEPVLNL